MHWLGNLIMDSLRQNFFKTLLRLFENLRISLYCQQIQNSNQFIFFLLTSNGLLSLTCRSCSASSSGGFSKHPTTNKLRVCASKPWSKTIKAACNLN